MNISNTVSSSNKPKTVLLVTNIPTPYRIPLFNELDRQLREKGMRLKVIFGSLGYSRRKWHIDQSDMHFDYEVLSSRKIRLFNSEKVMFTYPGLFRRLKTDSPSVVITNAFSLASTKLWLLTLLKRCPPYIIWSGAINRPGRPENWLRRIQRQAIVKRAAAYIAYGTLAKQYLLSIGASEEKIYISFNTVDTDFFTSETNRFRSDLHPDGKKHLLFVGYLTKRKRVDLLIKTIKSLAAFRQDFILDIVGSGPEEENLKKLCMSLDVDRFVLFHGFKQKKDIPQFFARADCLLFPTAYDVWGLVLVEAMAAGIVCIASKEAGATRDLMPDDHTGYVVDFLDADAVAFKLDYLLKNDGVTRTISANCSNLIKSKFILKNSAESFIQAVIGVGEQNA